VPTYCARTAAALVLTMRLRPRTRERTRIAPSASRPWRTRCRHSARWTCHTRQHWRKQRSGAPTTSLK
jgi:hypothetical protein